MTIFKPIEGSSPVLTKYKSLSKLGNDKEIIVSLRLRTTPTAEKVKKENFLKDLGNQYPAKKSHISIQDIEDTFGADQQDVSLVKEFADRYNLKVENENPALRMVSLKGSPDDFNHAFNINLEIYGNENCKFHSHAEPIQIPTELIGIVEAVFGLDNQPAMEPRFYSVGSKTKTPIAKKKRYSPIEIAKAYNFPLNNAGEGQSIALIAMGGGYKLGDVEYYLGKILGVNIPIITNVFVDNAENKQGLNDKNDMELLMDLEILAAIANKANIVVYFAQNTFQGFFNAVSRAIFDKVHHNTVISISWGRPESDWTKPVAKSLNKLFKAAATLGVTICAPSGDQGVEDGINNGIAKVDFPASSPYVLGCGGTKLTLKNGKIKNEIVWREFEWNQWWASGGGVSDFFPVPSYQNTLVSNIHSLNSSKINGRCVPDVSAIAGKPGYNTFRDKKETEFAGGATSAAVPLWAALIAIINSRLGKRVGYINPLLYNNSNIKNGFNDITFGSNSTDHLVGNKAAIGWDACTGWGSPNGEELLKLFQGD